MPKTVSLLHAGPPLVRDGLTVATQPVASLPPKRPLRHLFLRLVRLRGDADCSLGHSFSNARHTTNAVASIR